jgi:hypothetical protein
MDELDKALEAAISGLDSGNADTNTDATTEAGKAPAETNDNVSAGSEGDASAAAGDETGGDDEGSGDPKIDGRGRAHGKDGKFVNKSNAPAAAKPGDAAQPQVTDKAAKPAAGSNTQDAPQGAAAGAPAQPEMVEGRDIAKAPSTWRAEAGTEFAKLPRAVREEIHRREESMFKGIEQYKGAAKFGQDIATQFKPYQKMLEATQLAPTDIINAGLQFEYIMRAGTPEKKVELLKNIAQSYGVDLAQIAPQRDSNGNVIEPVAPSAEIVALQKQVQALTHQLSQREQREQNAQQQEEQRTLAEIRKEITDFANDPKNEFYSLVRADVLALIQGQGLSLKDAYDKAIWANPDSRATLQARQLEDDRKKAAEKAAAADKANRVNVTPRATPTGKTAGKGTLDSALNSAVDAAFGR